jgi:hypothetical protein
MMSRFRQKALVPGTGVLDTELSMLIVFGEANAPSLSVQLLFGH